MNNFENTAQNIRQRDCRKMINNQIEDSTFRLTLKSNHLHIAIPHYLSEVIKRFNIKGTGHIKQTAIRQHDKDIVEEFKNFSPFSFRKEKGG
jgi:hypothetical protein